MINGLKPARPQRKSRLFNTHYENLNYPVYYHGALLLGRWLVRRLDVHMGFHPAWKYRRVVELLFSYGTLEASIDRSWRMAEIRHMLRRSRAGRVASQMPSDDEIKEFVTRAFDRSY